MSATKADGSRPTAGKPLATREARQRAAVVLEVLAGLRTPAEAAQAVGLSTQRYYLLEDRALSGLVSACEPRGRGPSSSPEKELDKLHTECEKLRRECARYQALARVSQKTVGISAPPARRAEKRAGKGRGKRKPTVRALKRAMQLKAGSAEAEQPSPGETNQGDRRDVPTS